MRKIDPQCEFLIENNVSFLRPSEAAGPTTFLESVAEASAAASPSAVVLVEFNGETKALEQAGLRIRSIAGDPAATSAVATGVIALDKIERLAELPKVARVESTREMRSELDRSLPETQADLVHVGPPGRRGAGTIVGIVDSGVDFTHDNFRKPDGTSRILLLWDQGLTPQGGERSPVGFGFGVEYSKAAIDAALKTADPFAAILHRDVPPMHGTHVTGIAAGDGSARGNEGQAAFTFVGVAPEADIIVVANRSGGSEGIGTSSNTLDAVNYIFQRAGTMSKPVVVNMSLGDNLGPHDGTSLLERGLDNLLGAAGRAFVKSAGNAGAAQIHASGNVATNTTVEVAFQSPPDNDTPDQIDVWYTGADQFKVSVVDPDNKATGVVGGGVAQSFQLQGGNTVRIDHRDRDSQNNDRRIFITITAGALGVVKEGRWRIRLVGVNCPQGGRFDAWIQRGDVISMFLPPHVNSALTISTPGTAKKIITAASYVTLGTGVGSLSSFSSRGPTRDGRAAPTIAAPGQAIISANGHGPQPYQPMSGTSMATPHVTGAIALMLQKNKMLTQDQIKTFLASTARRDAQTGPVPNTAWGAGKMDVKGAVDRVPAPASAPEAARPARGRARTTEMATEAVGLVLEAAPPATAQVEDFVVYDEGWFEGGAGPRARSGRATVSRAAKKKTRSRSGRR
jgi:subtilisin family serine protease